MLLLSCLLEQPSLIAVKLFGGTFVGESSSEEFLDLI